MPFMTTAATAAALALLLIALSIDIVSRRMALRALWPRA